MSSPLQIGIIGSGGIAKAHLGGLAKMEDIELAAFCDVVEERAKQMADEYGGKSFTDPSTMFADLKLDAVWICLPPFAHGAAERATIEAGVPFLVEKPVGLDAGVVREIAAEVGRKGILTSVGYMNRYRKSVQRGRELLRSDPAVIAYGAWIGGAPGGGDHWWGKKDKSGGQLVEQTTHTVDLARYLLGEADEVFATSTREFSKDRPGFTVEDASTVAVRFKNGAVANLMSACACACGGGVFLTVHAQQMCLRYTGWEHSVTIERKDREPESIAGEGEIFAVEDAAFLQAVRTGDRSGIRCDYADGARTLLLTLAANESMSSGKAVSL